MDNEGSNDTGNDATTEPIEISVISIDTVQEMLIVQPVEMNPIDTDSSPNRNEQSINIEINNPTIELSNEADLTPSRKKRKRSQTRKLDSPKKPPPPPLDNDDDDGSTCSICLDTWEHRGEHRLVALKCGHLFGSSCIKRWIQECPAQSKVCPTCKQKAMIRDIRNLYAKRVVVVDKSEEYRLQKLYEEAKTKNIDLQSALSSVNLELAVSKEEITRLEMECSRLRKFATYHDAPPHTSSHRDIMYKMSMHKNIDISRDGGCRAMTYGRRIQTLLLSQKSGVSLFPGYGVRLVNAKTFLPIVYFRMSTKPIRDLTLDCNEELLAAASQDVNAQIYSVTNHTPVATITPPACQIWSTSFDKIRPEYIHLGCQQGHTYTYDIRNYMTYVEQLTTPGDFSPVISIQSIPVSNYFRFGGFIVCKLRSLWFYEYTASQRTEQTRLTIDATTFTSISYNEQTNTLLIQTKPSTKYPQARLIVANLEKIDQTPILRTVCTLFGSRTEPVMSRSTQLTIGNDTLVASYLQDTKTLSLWNAKNGVKMPGFNVDDCINDICPMYVNNTQYLATLSDTKCRIFQINSV